MQELSTHKVALEKLQQMLRNYDMSFGISNKMFRMTIVLEILNVQSLFDQLLHKWETRLPVGEGPDADIDFAEWGNYDKWHDLIDAARQNVCIENLSINCGNGMYIDDFAKSFKKGFKKNMTSVFKSTFGTKRDELLEPFQTIIDDKDGVLTYGEMVFHAINLLLSTLREIDRLLQHPTDEQLLQYYLALDALFVPDYRNIENRIAETHKQDKPNRKKENELRALRDELFDNLIESGVLAEKMGHCNQYEVQDFLDDNDDEFSENAARLIVSIDEFGDITKDAVKIKFAQYLFERRKMFRKEQLMPLFVYLHEASVVTKNLGYVATEKKKKSFWNFPAFEELAKVRFDFQNNKEPSLQEQEEYDGLEAGICAVHKTKICNKADWAVVVKILEERDEMQKGAYSADAEYINRICGEVVTNANSISRSPIFTKIVGEYPNWSVRPSEQNRETAGKLQTYLEIGKIFTEALER